MTNSWLDKISLIIATFWVGALWTIGIAVCMLFQMLPEGSLAERIAGVFFTYLAYFGFFSAFWLLLHSLIKYGLSSLKKSYFWSIFFMLALVFDSHFGIAPILAQFKTDIFPVEMLQGIYASRLTAWHGIASIAYLLQCLLGIVVVLQARQ